MKAKRQYSPGEMAKRDKRFREHLARKQNPVRFALALPANVKLEDVDWAPTHLERIAELLRLMKARWEREDDERRRQRLKEIMAAVERDKNL